jgi:hypothetical protein
LALGVVVGWAGGSRVPARMPTLGAKYAPKMGTETWAAPQGDGIQWVGGVWLGAGDVYRALLFVEVGHVAGVGASLQGSRPSLLVRGCDECISVSRGRFGP